LLWAFFEAIRTYTAQNAAAQHTDVLHTK